MNNALLIKIGRIALKTTAKVFKSSLKFAWEVFTDEERNRRIKAHRKWQNNYDYYAKAVTKRKS